MEFYSKTDVLELAGETSYDDGMDYIERVTDLSFAGDRVTATVSGSDEYEVDLRVVGGLDGECDCPYGEGGNFCKHCVAVALVFLYHAEHGSLGTIAGERGGSDGVLDYLTGLAHSELVDLLLDAAERDSALQQLLALRAASSEAAEDRDLMAELDGHNL